MRAVLLKGERELELGDIPDPQPQEGDALIRVMAAGLCGSEMGAYRGPKRDKPIPTGHEAAGIVEDPRGNPNLKEGDRVVVLAVGGCGQCDPCKDGHMAFCETPRSLHPSHCERAAFIARCCLHIPDSISFPAAVAIGGCGLGVAYHGIMRLDIQPKDFVAVMGVGPIGLSATMTLVHLGATVAAVDVSNYRLNLAKDLGAEFLINATDCDVIEAIREANDDERPRKGVLATGNEKAAHDLLESLGPGGRLVTLGGVHDWKLSVWRDLSVRDRSLLGSWHYHHDDFPRIMRMVEEGVPVEKMVTHVFPFERAAQAYRTFDSGESGKVVLSFEKKEQEGV